MKKSLHLQFIQFRAERERVRAQGNEVMEFSLLFGYAFYTIIFDMDFHRALSSFLRCAIINEHSPHSSHVIIIFSTPAFHFDLTS